jgi:hypothetical protein
MTRKRKVIAALVVLAVFVAVWLVANPPGRFGWCCYAYTTYGGCPRPISDFQVRADGSSRTVGKTHQLTFEHVEWLLDPKPDVLIIALGWDGVTVPNDRIREHRGCETHFLKNREAIELFNRLKRAGKHVAIHYHSTC